MCIRDSYSIAELTLNITSTLAPTGDAAQTYCGASTLDDFTVVITCLLYTSRCV